MRIPIIWVFFLYPGFFWVAGDIIHKISGTVGMSHAVYFTYASRLIGYKHYWCRGAHWRSCSVLVKSTGSEEEVKEGRFSIKDNHKTHTFSVTMRHLTTEDSGLYWCGTEKWGMDEMYQVQVMISAPLPIANKPTVLTTTEMCLPLSSSASPVTASGLPKIEPEEAVSSSVAPGTIAGDTKSPSISPASYMALQWKAKAALCCIILLALISVRIISRNRQKAMTGQNVQWGDRVSLASLPQQDTLVSNVVIPTASPPATTEPGPTPPSP